MKIIADENIPCASQAFASLGEVTLLPGREVRARHVRDADMLIVRSVTPVGRELLEGSRVRFVGSATIGFDHIDRTYLQANGIGFATAPGSNATSAAEYVLSALMVLSERPRFELTGKTVGIIGCGNVGSRVRGKLTALGVECLVNDPPLQEQAGGGDFVGLDDILQADIVTVHVPLTTGGRHPTRHLVDEAFTRQLRPGAVLINTSRGAVADCQALGGLLAGGADLSVVLDVWEGEPAIDTSLLQRVTLGTAHIAGYSSDGKLRGTEMIYRAACKTFDLPASWTAKDQLPKQPPLQLATTASGDALDTVRQAVLSCYDVRRDDAQLRGLLDISPAERAAYFDRLRRDYPVRREFAETPVALDKRSDRAERMLRGIGFEVC